MSRKARRLHPSPGTFPSACASMAIRTLPRPIFALHARPLLVPMECTGQTVQCSPFPMQTSTPSVHRRARFHLHLRQPSPGHRGALTSYPSMLAPTTVRLRARLITTWLSMGQPPQSTTVCPVARTPCCALWVSTWTSWVAMRVPLSIPSVYCVPTDHPTLPTLDTALPMAMTARGSAILDTTRISLIASAVPSLPVTWVTIGTSVTGVPICSRGQTRSVTSVVPVQLAVSILGLGPSRLHSLGRPLDPMTRTLLY